MTNIYYETLPVAHLTFEGEWRLDYDPGWEARRPAFPVSLTMPLRSGSVGAAKLLPWLANLLPETHLAEIGQRLKVSPQDIVVLLAHIGRDTAGALSIGEPRKAGVNLLPVPDEQAPERILNELPAKPFLVGERGVSMSLAGVQEKLPDFSSGRRADFADQSAYRGRRSDPYRRHSGRCSRPWTRKDQDREGLGLRLRWEWLSRSPARSDRLLLQP